MQFLDTLQNLVSGLGVLGRDKASHSQFVFGALTRQQIENAYRGDPWARKVVDIPAFDATRQWRGWQAEADQITSLEAEEKRLAMRLTTFRAIRLARLYGGAAIIIDDASLDPATPLDIDRMGVGAIRRLIAVPRHRLAADQLEHELNAEFFGTPKSYAYTPPGGSQLILHPSRVVTFAGADIPDDATAEGAVWGDSVLQAVADAIRDAGRTVQAIASMVEEATLDVIRMPNLMSQVASAEYRTRLIERMALAQTTKSINNTLLLDAAELWERKQVTFAHLPEVVQQMLQIVSGAADIPATRMLGQSPAGMSATGESDLRNYYDRIAAQQGTDIGPRLERLDRAMIRSALGVEPPEVRAEWRPLWQQSPPERSAIEKAAAETATLWANSGLIPEAAIALGAQNRLVEDGTYPGLESALADAISGALEPEDVGLDPAPTPEEQAAALALAAAPVAANDPGGQPARLKAANDAAMRDARPRTLYVMRPVVNGDRILAWAAAQGFRSTLAAADLHVTVAFSRAAVDWMAVGEDWSGDGEGRVTVQAGGPRLVEPLGPKGAVVLLFANEMLVHRHNRIRAAGASWDWPEYQPHMTITYDAGGVDLAAVEPYRGPIILGAEVFAELDEDWRPTETQA